MTIPVVWWLGKVGRLCFKTFSSAPENGFVRGAFLTRGSGEATRKENRPQPVKLRPSLP
jgi:hypothetical protein